MSETVPGLQHPSGPRPLPSLIIHQALPCFPLSGTLTFLWVLRSARFLSQDLCTALFLSAALTTLPIALVNFPFNPALSLAIAPSRKAFFDLPDWVSSTLQFKTFLFRSLTAIAFSFICVLLLWTLGFPLQHKFHVGWGWASVLLRREQLIQYPNPQAENLAHSMCSVNIIKGRREGWRWDSGIYLPFPSVCLQKSVTHNFLTYWLERPFVHMCMLILTWTYRTP